ncbi:MAG TPA: universal stress protein [Polyangiaceae bacterium]|nr:universal stress protein [Polyangiaceae bacterium]
MNHRRILVGYDYSPLADSALKQAFQLASTDPDSEVHVIHVSLPEFAVMSPEVPAMAVGPSTPDAALSAAKAHVNGLLSEWQEQSQRSFSRLGMHATTGSPAREIARLAHELHASLVIVGTHGRKGLERLFLGSVAEGVVRQCHCPVLVIKDSHAVAVEADYDRTHPSPETVPLH